MAGDIRLEKKGLLGPLERMILLPYKQINAAVNNFHLHLETLELKGDLLHLNHQFYISSHRSSVVKAASVNDRLQLKVQCLLCAGPI